MRGAGGDTCASRTLCAYGCSRLPETYGTIGSAANGAARGRTSLCREIARVRSGRRIGNWPPEKTSAGCWKRSTRCRRRQREVLYLRACEELSLNEIAAIVGISPEAAKASLCEARKRLRRQFSEIDCHVCRTARDSHDRSEM